MKALFLRFIALLVVANVFLIPPSDAAESVGAKVSPTETFALVELHDLPRTSSRWRDTAYYQISQEPEVKAFFAKLGTAAEDGLPLPLVRDVFDQISKLDPSSAFLALAELSDFTASRPPNLLAGISYLGETAHVKSLLARLRENLAADAGIKSETNTENGVEFETLSRDEVTVTIAFVEKWVFAATNKQMLLDAIARHSGKSPPGLAESDAWKAALKQSVPDPDLTFFTNYGVLKKLVAQAGGAEAAILEAFGDFLPESWITTMRLEGRGMRERSYIQFKTKPPRGQGANRSLAFSGIDTFAYLGADFGGVEDVLKKVLEIIPAIPDPPDFEKHGLTLADALSTFGPEIVLFSDWEPGALSFPTVFAAAELRDPAKGRKFASLIAGMMSSGAKVAEKEQDGLKLWTMSTGIPLVKPTIGVNEKHLMFGLNPDSIITSLLRAKEAKGAVPQSSSFAAALKSVGEPNGGLFFLDTKRLFERLYDRGSPFIKNTIAGTPQVSKYFEAALMPKTETISRHLEPMIVSFRVDDQGYLVESAGSATLVSGTFGAAFGAGLIVPAVRAAMQRGRVATAMANARQIHLAALNFAAANKGTFPKKLEDLVPQYLETKKVLMSPLSPGDDEIAYEAMDAKDTDDAGKIWLKSKFQSGKGKRVVVTVGGTVREEEE